MRHKRASGSSECRGRVESVSEGAGIVSIEILSLFNVLESLSSGASNREIEKGIMSV